MQQNDVTIPAGTKSHVVVFPSDHISGTKIVKPLKARVKRTVIGHIERIVRFSHVYLLPQFRAMRAGFYSNRKGLKPAPRLNSTPIKYLVNRYDIRENFGKLKVMVGIKSAGCFRQVKSAPKKQHTGREYLPQ